MAKMKLGSEEEQKSGKCRIIVPLFRTSSLLNFDPFNATPAPSRAIEIRRSFPLTGDLFHENYDWRSSIDPRSHRGRRSGKE
jgi:hypothetical protein